MSGRFLSRWVRNLRRGYSSVAKRKARRIVRRINARNARLLGGYRSYRRRRATGKVTYHRFKKTFYHTTIFANVNTNWAPEIKMSDLPNYAELTGGLFDEFKFTKFKFRIERLYDMSDVYNGGTAGNAFIRKIYDNTDFPTAESGYLEYDNCKSYSAIGRAPLIFTMYPKVQQDIIDPSVGSINTARAGNPWMKCDTASNIAYKYKGMSVWFPAISSASNFTCRIYCTAYVTMKTAR